MWPGAEPHGPIMWGGGMPEAADDWLLEAEEAPEPLLAGGGGIWNAGGGIIDGHGCMGGGSSDGAELTGLVPGGGGGGGRLPIEGPPGGPGGPVFHREGGGGTAFDMSGMGAGMPRGGAAMARGCDWRSKRWPLERFFSPPPDSPRFDMAGGGGPSPSSAINDMYCGQNEDSFVTYKTAKMNSTL